MKQKSVGLTLRALIIALALILVAGSPALPPFDGVAYAQSTVTTLSHLPVPGTSNLQLDWTAVDNADSYRLWKAEGLVTTVAGWGNAPHMTFDGSTTQYVDTAVTAGTTYSYVLEVYDGDTRLGYSQRAGDHRHSQTDRQAGRDPGAHGVGRHQSHVDVGSYRHPLPRALLDRRYEWLDGPRRRRDGPHTDPRES